MPAFCVEKVKVNAFACSGRRRPRRSEPKVAPALRRAGKKILVTTHINSSVNPCPVAGLKPRAPLRQDPRRT